MHAVKGKTWWAGIGTLTHSYGIKIADLKQTQSLSRDKKTMEHWINIHVSNSVINWYTGSREKGLWNSLLRRFSEILVKIGVEY